MFYFDLPVAPVDVSQNVTVETKVTAFDTWSMFLTGLPSMFTTAWIDNNQEPARFYFQDPITANFWRFTFWAGYGLTTLPLPEDLAEPLLELISYWYDYRDGGGDANRVAQIEAKLLSKRLASSWI